MAAPYTVMKGVVLRQTETREADKILTLLTADKGKIPVIARGVRRRSCKYAASAQPLAYSEWTLYQKGDWYYANEASSIEQFSGLQTDLSRLSLGFYFAELTETVASAGETLPELVSHLLNGLYALDKLKKPELLAKAAFEFRTLCLAGYEPLADSCAFCGCADPAQPMLDVVQGVVRCRECGAGESGHSLPLCPGSLAALRHILYGDPKRLYSFRLAGEELNAFARLCQRYVLGQLERGFATLDFYQSLFP